jgi:hypothetical protein
MPGAGVVTRIGYADPPYPGQAAKHYGDHPDYAGEVDHYELLWRLVNEYDGWVLHTSSVALPYVLRQAAEVGATYRIMSWVKPFAAFKANVSVAYAWEPVLVHEARKPKVTGRMVMRDWFSEPITLQRGLSGAKPERLCHWLFEMLGAHPDDELIDLYPGTGAVTKAWNTWRTSLLVQLEKT